MSEIVLGRARRAAGRQGLHVYKIKNELRQQSLGGRYAVEDRSGHLVYVARNTWAAWAFLLDRERGRPQ